VFQTQTGFKFLQYVKIISHSLYLYILSTIGILLSIILVEKTKHFILNFAFTSKKLSRSIFSNVILTLELYHFVFNIFIHLNSVDVSVQNFVR